MISFVIPPVRPSRNAGCARIIDLPSVNLSEVVAVGSSSSSSSQFQPLLDPIGNPARTVSRTSSGWNASDFNLHLYSPGQETNSDIHTGKAKIGVSLQYDSQRQELLVKVLGALNLPGRSKRIPPDPYVKVQ